MFPFIVAPITGDCTRGSFLVVTIREHYSGYRVSCLFISSYLYVLHPKSGLKYFYIRQTILTLWLENRKVRVCDVSDFCLCMEECRIRHLSGWHWTWESLTIWDAWQAWHVSWASCHIPPILIFRIITRQISPRLNCRCGHRSRCKCVIGLGPPRCPMASLVTSRGGAGCFPNEISKIIYNLSRQDIHSTLL